MYFCVGVQGVRESLRREWDGGRDGERRWGEKRFLESAGEIISASEQY